MNRKTKLIVSLLITITSPIMIGIGFTTKIGHPISTILFLSGMGFFFFGLIWLLTLLIGKAYSNS